MPEGEFVWKPEYAVGVRLLDEDHQELFDTVNELDRALADGDARDAVGGVLERLCRYVMEHFEREEHVMHEYGFPGLAEHRHRHMEFARLIFAARHVHDKTPDKLSHEKLLTLLQRWLVNHIRGEDMKYKAYLHGNYGRRAGDIVEPLHDPDTSPAAKRRKHEEMRTVTVQVPADGAHIIRRAAAMLRDGGEAFETLARVTDPVDAFSDRKALEVARIVLNDPADAETPEDGA